MSFTVHPSFVSQTGCPCFVPCELRESFAFCLISVYITRLISKGDLVWIKQGNDLIPSDH